ncbi:hypothetical protein JCM19238_458 [Vibrio ponticus]|nr:hypothetical protein JCM19238_458 [Vibrio ponticus]
MLTIGGKCALANLIWHKVRGSKSRVMNGLGFCFTLKVD